MHDKFVKVLSLSRLCPISKVSPYFKKVQHLSRLSPISMVWYVDKYVMSRFCPSLTFVQTLSKSNVCPMSKVWYFGSQCIMSRFCPSLKSVQTLSKSKLCPNLIHSLILRQYFGGQSLDNYWMWMSNLCPSFRQWTGSWQTFDKACTFPGQTLYLDNHWTGLGQRLDKVWTIGQSFDRDWTKFGFSVQCLSNHTIKRSTEIWPHNRVVLAARH